MNRCSLLAATLVVVLASLTTGCKGTSDKTDLKLGLEAGKTYRTRMVSDQDIKQTMRGQTMDMKQIMTNDLAFDVQDVNGSGDMTVKVTFERIAADINTGQRKMTYDSSQPADENNPLARSFGAMAGKSYTLVLSERGQMLEINGMDEIINDMIENMGLPDEAMKERMKAQMQRVYGEESAKVLCGQMFGMIPPGPVAVGEQWNCSSVATVPFDYTWDQVWVLKEIKDEVAVLDGKAVTSVHSGDDPTEMGGIKIKIDMDGTQEGSLELDRSTGMIVGGTLKSSINGQQEIVEGPEQIQGQTIPIELQQNITWQVL